MSEALIDLSRSGVYLAPAGIEGVRRAAKRADLAWFELNLARVGSKREFLATCARGLRFPEWFGGNWDALADCLKDLSADCVVHCRAAGNFAAAAPDDYDTALEVFRDAASYWNERGSVFIVLLDQEPARGALPQLPGA